MASIKLVGTGPLWGVPNASPFVLKLETWLRMASIDYQPVALTKPPASRTGKIPYIIRDNGELLADSQIIIETLAREHGLDLNAGRDDAQLAQEHVIRRTIEESLYFAVVAERWLIDANWPITRDAYFRALPGGLRHLFGAGIRRKVRRDLWGQGIGRHDWPRIEASAQADVDALAAALGGRDYFAVDTPQVVDASAYGSLATMLAYPRETASQRAVKRHDNLLAFCERMRKAYWPDEERAA